MTTKGNTVGKVKALVKPITDELGLSLWDVRYVKEGASWFLRILIDKEDGVLIEDCEAVSKAINEPLDSIITTSTQYYLEVSSPGLGRELTSPQHYEQLKGQEVTVKLIRPRDGIKDFIGNIVCYVEDDLTIDTEDKEITFNKSEIARVRLNDDKDLF